MSSPTARARNARGHGDRLRADITSAALDLLDEQGADAVTLRAIARRVGISAPSIYAHFSGREAILMALADEAFRELADALERGRTAVADPAGRLRGVCHAYLDFAHDHARRYRIMFGGVWDPGRDIAAGTIDQAQAHAVGQRALSVIEQALRDCVDHGLVRSSDVTTSAVVVWLGLHGLAHQRVAATAFPWPADVAEHLVDTVTGLADGASGPPRT